jgi:hypothetical protein
VLAGFSIARLSEFLEGLLPLSCLLRTGAVRLSGLSGFGACQGCAGGFASGYGLRYEFVPRRAGGLLRLRDFGPVTVCGSAGRQAGSASFVEPWPEPAQHPRESGPGCSGQGWTFALLRAVLREVV